MGLPLNVDVNYEQNKCEVHISNNKSKIANFMPKIGQDATFAQTSNCHNSAPSVKQLVFGPYFAPSPHMGSITRMDQKPPPIAQNCVFKSERPGPPLK